MTEDELRVILLVEDNPAHAEIALRSFEEHRIPNRVVWLQDGEAALDYLFRRPPFDEERSSPKPHVVLLDLRLPKRDGLEVLSEIKEAPELRGIPVVVLSTSEAERDLARAYASHANSYLVKPADFDRFENLLRDSGFYWLGWNRKP